MPESGRSAAFAAAFNRGDPKGPKEDRVRHFPRLALLAALLAGPVLASPVLASPWASPPAEARPVPPGADGAMLREAQYHRPPPPHWRRPPPPPYRHGGYDRHPGYGPPPHWRRPPPPPRHWHRPPPPPYYR